jgi:hypothetical protein
MASVSSYYFASYNNPAKKDGNASVCKAC